MGVTANQGGWKMEEDYLSTTALSKKINIELSELFVALNNMKWIERKNDKWILTELGRAKGGKTKMNDNIGEYIVWPASLHIDEVLQKINESENNLVSVSQLAEELKINPSKLNLILSEIGWIEKDEVRAWTITKLGKLIGGRQKEYHKTGKFFVLWPSTILENKSLHESLVNNFIIEEKKEQTPNVPKKDPEFREKFKAEHRANDGHMVRSKSEVIIDNYLYNNEIVHAFERKLPISEDAYSDFYIPKAKVYIEYWGITGDAQYDARKKMKLELYKKNDLKLIELTENDVMNLDDKLPPKLRNFGIKVD
jgi:Mn-dependent DtxR family transcriptional regulator/energy-converting hydrogenase A subunit M